MTWSDKAVECVNQLNNFRNLSKHSCKKFYIGDKHVGFIRTDIWEVIKSYTTTFVEEGDTVYLSHELSSCESRSKHVDKVLRELRSQGKLITLHGWRNECYDVKQSFHDEPLLLMERSATCLFGIRRYGVNIHGYCSDHPEKGLSMWIAKRSVNKETWPGKLDIITAGGLTAGLSVSQCVKKEAHEEANIPDHLLSNLLPTGTVSFAYEDDRGLFRDTEFCYDLSLPHHTGFTPQNNDGEVESFQLVSMNELKPMLVSGLFRPTSAALIMDFMVRHGVITPDNEPRYVVINELLHASLY